MLFGKHICQTYSPFCSKCIIKKTEHVFRMLRNNRISDIRKYCGKIGVKRSR